MKQISEANFNLVLRLLRSLKNYPSLKSIRQDESRRKAGLLLKKLEKHSLS